MSRARLLPLVVAALSALALAAALRRRRAPGVRSALAAGLLVALGLVPYAFARDRTD